jgi:mRNA-degrading endonuclease RelE of RelBE toxin-antitoxin system
MEKFKVYHSEQFDRELSRFDKDFQERVDKIEDKLVENPYYGNPLGFKGFREARYGNYRIYYLIYEDLESIFIVAISDKKDQQRVINTIKLFLDFFREEIEKIVRGKN